MRRTAHRATRILLFGLAAVGLLLGGSIVVYGPPPHPPGTPTPDPTPVFVIMGLQAPATAQIGQEVKIMATVKNTGRAKGTQDVRLKVNDEIVSNVSQTLDPDQQVELIFKHTFKTTGKYKIEIATPNDFKQAEINVLALPGQPSPPTAQPAGGVLKFALVHSEKVIYPEEIVIPLGATVEIGHVSLDKAYPSVILRVLNAPGQAVGALAFGTSAVSVELGKITLQKFTADKPGEYEFTHILMGGSGKAKVIVR